MKKNVLAISTIGIISIIFLILLVFVGCSPETPTNPTDDGSSATPDLNAPPIPQMQLLAQSNAITLKWPAAPNIDAYLLYRDTDPAGTFSKNVYQGADYNFIDPDVIPTQFYYYRLAFQKQGIIYDKSPYAVGIAVSQCRDKSDPSNDTVDNPTILPLDGTPFNGVIWYFQDGEGNPLTDYDWYALKLPAGEGRYVIFSNIKTGSGELCMLFCNQQGASTATINNTNQNTYLVSNDTDHEQIVPFCVSVNKTILNNNTATYTIAVQQ